MAIDAPGVVALLSKFRFPLNDEKRLQADIEEQLQLAGVEYKREVNLAPGDIIDFMIGDVGVEVKIKGGRMAIYRQIERYAGRPSVKQLVLITNVASGMPKEIKGKPVYVLNLARAWM